jgi:hypothetical protein
VTHMNDASSERRIHSAASDGGGSANARAGVLSWAPYPPELTKKAGKAGATGTGTGTGAK